MVLVDSEQYIHIMIIENVSNLDIFMILIYKTGIGHATNDLEKRKLAF